MSIDLIKFYTISDANNPIAFAETQAQNIDLRQQRSYEVGAGSQAGAWQRAEPGNQRDERSFLRGELNGGISMAGSI
jgi:hypothetical protein